MNLCMNWQMGAIFRVLPPIAYEAELHIPEASLRGGISRYIAPLIQPQHNVYELAQ